MHYDLEKANILFKLARKGNWGASYDRKEHFKRFEHLEEIIKELSKIGWIVVHNKPRFVGLSLNTNYKKEIINFVEVCMPHMKGAIR